MSNEVDVYFFNRALAQIAGKDEKDVPRPACLVQEVIEEIPKIRQHATSELFRKNNPNYEPVGDHTGRCKFCGSKDLWDDNLSYGCNCCEEGAFLSTGDELSFLFADVRQNIRYE